MTGTSTADQRHRDEMRAALRTAADAHSVEITGEPVFGWQDRTIGVSVAAGRAARWLRVVREHPAWAHGSVWTGNVDAAAITGVMKPRVLAHVELDADDALARYRAELMTTAPGAACSPTPELRHPVGQPGPWLPQLRASLDALAATPTARVCVSQADVTRRLAIFWGDRIDATVTTWTTAHGDLHWANLMTPEPYILDWELWGTAPAGYDAATLYCHSLLQPDTAPQIRATFADLLDTPDGRRAQLYAAARMLLRYDHGDYAGLAAPLHQLANALIVADHHAP